MTQFGHLFLLHKAVALRVLPFQGCWGFFISKCRFHAVVFYFFIFSTFSLLHFPLLPPPACFSSRRVVMSWVHCCPSRLIKADNETGWLYYGSNEICQHRLHSRARGAAAPLILALHRPRKERCAADERSR